MTPCVYCGADTSGQKGWITPRKLWMSPTFGIQSLPYGPPRDDVRTCHALSCRARARREAVR